MLNFFKKRVIPEFKAIEVSELKNLYFYRVAIWDWLNDSMIHITDNHAPRMITMDPWPQQIFIDAEGQKTVREYIYHIANLYSRNEVIPPELDKTIIDLINKLIEDRLIEVGQDKKALPYYLKLPKRKQDSEKAYKLMIEDGFIKK